jgi:NAD(P)-dependent dehydrogenase (short-subunit alcohol dehydrogenase family)
MPNSSKVAAITGATQGIGRAAAIRIGATGATVALCGRNEAEGKITAELVEAAGGKAIFTAVDVTDTDALDRWVRDTAEQNGRLDWLVNNAGMNGDSKRLEETSVDEFMQIINTNLVSIFCASRAAIPIMRANGGGAIVNLGSTASLQGYGLLSAYTASKHAVLGLTRSTALENADVPVRCNVICPGPIETPLMEEIEAIVNPDDPAAARTMFEGTTALKRYGSPEEVAGLIYFLLSDEASYITGTSVSVDGGVMTGV